MDLLTDKLNAFINLNPAKIVDQLLRDKDLQDYIIRLNTEGERTSQLFNFGIDSTGRTLESIGGGYSDLTVEIKKGKNQPIDRITLKDTGDFYKSWIVIPDAVGGFSINANVLKDGENLKDDWGPNIVGLTESNLQLVINRVKEFIINEITRVLF